NNPEWYLEKYRQAWAKASTQTISGMEARLAEKAIQPRHWKKLLREAGGNDRKKLALMLWDAGESEVSRWGNDLAVYRGMRSSVDYPN
ncbi:MAG TPA: hypothetical protein VKU85_20795, partial [bacterium]|nr:hypothetical protein [bacterium]